MGKRIDRGQLVIRSVVMAIIALNFIEKIMAS